MRGAREGERWHPVVTALAALGAVAALSAGCSSSSSHSTPPTVTAPPAKAATFTFSPRSSLGRLDMRTLHVRPVRVGRFFAVSGPALSPSGRLAFLASRCAACSQQLVVMHGRRPVMLGSALSATWLNAHDLLFSGGRDEETEIRVAGLDGRSRELAWLTHQAESIAVETEKELTVSPDGRTLLFSGEGAAEHHGNYVVDLTRRTVRPLVGEADDAPSFAPDGRTIAYQHVTEGGDWDVCVAKLAEITLHGAPRADCFRAAGNDREPVFLPDGRHIVFSSDRASRRNGVSSLYLLDRRSGSVRRLTQPGFDATSPKVMPDGRTVLFVRRALVPLG